MKIERELLFHHFCFFWSFSDIWTVCIINSFFSLFVERFSVFCHSHESKVTNSFRQCVCHCDRKKALGRE
jgi:hypothetical protein